MDGMDRRARYICRKLMRRFGNLWIALSKRIPNELGKGQQKARTLEYRKILRYLRNRYSLPAELQNKIAKEAGQIATVRYLLEQGWDDEQIFQFARRVMEGDPVLRRRAEALLRAIGPQNYNAYRIEFDAEVLSKELFDKARDAYKAQLTKMSLRRTVSAERARYEGRVAQLICLLEGGLTEEDIISLLLFHAVSKQVT